MHLAHGVAGERNAMTAQPPGQPSHRRRPERSAAPDRPGRTSNRPPARDAGSRRDAGGSGSARPALLGPRRSGPAEPRVADEVSAGDLDRSVRAELRSLSKANADEVARHLVMIGRLLPDDAEGAYAHAMAAQRRAGRVAIVREIVGIAAYHAGKWAEALSELRAARRMSGSSHLLPLMADAERGLGRPERALDLAASPEAASLGAAEQVEMAIVVSGARRDLGQPQAAVLALQIPQLSATTMHGYTPRLWYAYAEALLDAGRREEAVTWFARAADADAEGTTDADERLTELQGLQIVDLDEGTPDDE
jgi:tetratricopeptide (TPR) repeat protein